MADNKTAPGATFKTATREGTHSGELADMQVVGLALATGADDAKTLLDIGADNPFPVYGPNVTVTGSLTATDVVVTTPGVGTLLSGASTAGSVVAAPCPGGDSSWTVQISGYPGGGAYHFEGSVDSTNGTDGNWVGLTAFRMGFSISAFYGMTWNATSGLFRGNASGLKFVRVRQTGTYSAPTAVIIRISDGVDAVLLGQSLPEGSNNIGSVLLSAGAVVNARIGNGTTDAAIEPYGALSVNTGYQTTFYESWSVSPIDTTDKWTVTGVAPTIAGGNMQFPATFSAYNAIRSKDAIRPNGGFTLVRNGIALETTAAIGSGRFWGSGNPATVPAAAVLAQDGIGFEIDQATGALLAVTYASGVRTTVATLTRPADGITHAYGVYWRVTQAFWIIDGVTVASQAFPNLLMVELPSLLVRQNAASFTGSPIFTNIAHLTADTSRQGTSLVDPIIGTRQARVNASGSLQVLPSGAGRTTVIYYATAVAAGTTGTETAITLTKALGTAATSAAASHTPTTGKRFRIESIELSVRGHATATIQATTFSLRINTGGAVTTSTTPIVLQARRATPATASAWDSRAVPIPDGLEIEGNGTLQFGITANAVYTTNAPTWDVLIIGYEY